MDKKDKLSRKLGAYLKHLRKKSGLKLEEISEKSSLSISYISRLENGLIDAPSIFTIESLAYAYELSVFELLNLSIKEENEKIISLEELIIKNDFTYKDDKVDIYTKQAILNLISSLLDLDMSEIEEVAKICNLITKYSKERKCKEGV